MKSLVGILSILVFMAVVVWAAGTEIEGIRAKAENRCTDAKILLGIPCKQ